MSDWGTRVSITNPTIKKIVGGVQSNFRGKDIKVVQVKPTFEYQYINDSGEPKVYVARAGGSGLREIVRPGYGGSHTVRFMLGQDAIITQRIGHNGAISIYVPTFSDPDAMNVARDAMLEQNRSKAQIMEMLHPALGDYAGLAFAVLEAEVKTLGKKASGKKSTQLDREIDSFLNRSGRS